MMGSNILEGGRHKCINQDGEPQKPLKLPIWEVFLEADSHGFASFEVHGDKNSTRQPKQASSFVFSFSYHNTHTKILIYKQTTIYF